MRLLATVAVFPAIGSPGFAWDFYKPIGSITADAAFAPMRPECDFKPGQ